MSKCISSQHFSAAKTQNESQNLFETQLDRIQSYHSLPIHKAVFNQPTSNYFLIDLLFVKEMVLIYSLYELPGYKYPCHLEYQIIDDLTTSSQNSSPQISAT